MASSSCILAFAIVLSLASSVAANGQYFCPDFYSQSCPNLQCIVRDVVTQAVAADPRAAASLLRMHFHDCFVQGCDASVLLDGGEKNAPPNLSLRRFDVIDDIKARVEDECCGVVSCADILALAALEAVAVVGGPRWPLNLGRRDALSAATVDDTNKELPGPSSSLSQLISAYRAKGLDTTDMTALSGAHTIGLAHCNAFRDRIYNDTNIDPGFAAARRANCPRTSGSGDSNTAPLDFVTPAIFDNTYYKNLVTKRGLLHSDQVLFDRGSQDALVLIYSANPAAFFVDFAKAMTKMSEITPLTGDSGEIRSNCHVRN